MSPPTTRIPTTEPAWPDPPGAEPEGRPFEPAGVAAPTAAETDAELSELAGRRVAVALSGGVDSAVAALRLVQAGADVVGLSLRLHDPDPDHPMADRACCPPDDLQDARRIAEALDIPFYVLDGRKQFDGAVVRPFVGAYLSGRTPNPCVACNAFVKLERLVGRARALGCERLATGHYARLSRTSSPSGARLFAGADSAKDQSYFLFSTPPAVLRELLFPLGAWTKDRVREAALAAGLPVAHKLESQEVCFVGGKGAGSFVMRQPEAQGDHAGPIVDREGRVVGQHPGVMHFTVGQRKGLGVAAGERLHVLRILPEDKTVVVGTGDDLLQSGLRGHGAVWPAGAPSGPVRARVQIRYRDPGTPATVTPLPGEGSPVEVRFDRPVRAIAPGQATVFRQGDQVLGGAFIAEGFA